MYSPSTSMVGKEDAARSCLGHSSLAYLKKPAIAKFCKEKKFLHQSCMIAKIKIKKTPTTVTHILLCSPEGCCSSGRLTRCLCSFLVAGKGNCVLVAFFSLFSSYCQFWIVHEVQAMRSRFRFLPDHCERWSLASGFYDAAFLFAQPLVLVSGLWTGCLPSH